MNNRFTLLKDFSIRFSEFVRVPCAAILQNSRIEFHKLFANWFFILDIFKNVWKYFRKSFSTQGPHYLIFMINIFIVSIYKLQLATESFVKPMKNWRLSIIAFQVNFINIIVWKMVRIFTRENYQKYRLTISQLIYI